MRPENIAALYGLTLIAKDEFALFANSFSRKHLFETVCLIFFATTVFLYFSNPPDGIILKSVGMGCCLFAFFNFDMASRSNGRSWFSKIFMLVCIKTGRAFADPKAILSNYRTARARLIAIAGDDFKRRKEIDFLIRKNDINLERKKTKRAL